MSCQCMTFGGGAGIGGSVDARELDVLQASRFPTSLSDTTTVDFLSRVCADTGKEDCSRKGMLARE